MSASVHAKAYQGMWAKLPTGSPGLLPSGSDPTASGIGVPHHGGAITAFDEAADPSERTTRALATSNRIRPRSAFTVGSSGNSAAASGGHRLGWRTSMGGYT